MRVVLILVDGMRPDSLPACGNPYVERFSAESAVWVNNYTVMPSMTLPCHMSLIHSVPPERHGVVTNTFVPMARPVDGLFEQLRANGRRSAFFYGWGELKDLYKPGSPDYTAMVSGEKNNGPLANHWALRLTLDSLREENLDFTFLYLPWSDLAGHDFGWMSGPYLEAVADSWESIRQVTGLVGPEDVVIVTADHGGHDRIHGCDVPEDMHTPLLIRGRDIAPGTREERSGIMDLAPTICKLLGIPANRDWEGASLV